MKKVGFDSDCCRRGCRAHMTEPRLVMYGIHAVAVEVGTLAL